MSIAEPSFTIGVEEEYLLVDRQTRDLAVDPPAAIMEQCEARLGGRVTGEFLKSQLEIATGVCTSIADVRADLAELRRTVAEVANEFGLAPIAASTHPFASWANQRRTEMERYEKIDRDMQAVARRLLICGMHIHVCIEDADTRIDLMNQVAYFLPHLLALSTSSPFWQGEKTGLMSYRLTVFDAMPRSGVPERFDSYGEYERLVGHLIGANIIEDPSKIWWDVRPSSRYPTLEMRVTDVCTRIEDTLSVTALYVSLLSMLFRLRRMNQRWRLYPLLCVEENRWRAMRYGPTDTLVDFGIGAQVPYPELLEEIIELTSPDAERLGCLEELRHAREIVKRGTSAQTQLAIYDEAIAAGAVPREAHFKVVDWLIEETVAGI